MTDIEYFSASPETFPWHDDCYTWPRLTVYDEDGATELHVHLVVNLHERAFWVVGFIGTDRQQQINAVIYFAEKLAHGTVQMFKGLAFTDDIVNALMARMLESEPQERPGQMVSAVRTNWPTQAQRRVLAKLAKLDNSTPGGFINEAKLARRLHMPVDDVHYHLEVLADLGLAQGLDR
jgi:hypothetical protein